MRWLAESTSLIRRFLFTDDGTLRQKTIRSTIWVGLSAGVMGSLSLVKAVVLARLLAPDQFGLMAACMVVIRALEIFTETGFGAALIQRSGSVESAASTVYSVTAARGLLLAIAAVAISPVVAGFYGHVELTHLLQLLAAGLLLGGFGNVSSYLLQRDLKFRRLFYLQQLAAIGDFVITVLLAYWWRDVWALVVGYVAKTLLSVVLSFVLLPGRPEFGWDGRIARELLAYGKFITGITIVVYVTTEIDNVVIGKVLGMGALGIYTVAYMLANLPATHIAKVLSSVMFPAYSKLQGDRRSLQRAYLQTAEIVAAAAVPLAVGLAVMAHEIIALVYGQRWIVAAEILPLLCVFGALRALSSINGYVFNAIGRPEIPFYVNLVKLIMIGLLIVPATRQYGLLGAAAAITAPSAVMFIVSYMVFSRALGLAVREMASAIMPAIASSVAMGACLLLAKTWWSVDTPGSLAAAVFLGVLFYSLANRKSIRKVIVLVSRR